MKTVNRHSPDWGRSELEEAMLAREDPIVFENCPNGFCTEEIRELATRNNYSVDVEPWTRGQAQVKFHLEK